MEVKQDQILNFEFNAQEIDIILKSLGEIKASLSMGIITNIQNQIQVQIQKLNNIKVKELENGKEKSNKEKE